MRLSKKEREAIEAIPFNQVKKALKDAGIGGEITEDNYIEKATYAIKLELLEVQYTASLVPVE